MALHVAPIAGNVAGHCGSRVTCPPVPPPPVPPSPSPVPELQDDAATNATTKGDQGPFAIARKAMASVYAPSKSDQGSSTGNRAAEAADASGRGSSCPPLSYLAAAAGRIAAAAHWRSAHEPAGPGSLRQ